MIEARTGKTGAGGILLAALWLSALFGGAEAGARPLGGPAALAAPGVLAEAGARTGEAGAAEAEAPRADGPDPSLLAPAPVPESRSAARRPAARLAAAAGDGPAAHFSSGFLARGPPRA